MTLKSTINHIKMYFVDHFGNFPLVKKYIWIGLFDFRSYKIEISCVKTKIFNTFFNTSCSI